MKKKQLIQNTAIIVMMGAIIVLVLFKFVLKGDYNNNFRIASEPVSVVDLDGNSLTLNPILTLQDQCYIFVFDMNDCHSCIFKGLEDIKMLKKAGSYCISLVIHHDLGEVKGWSSHYDLPMILMIKKDEFYKKVHTGHTPVLVKMKGNTVENARFIYP